MKHADLVIAVGYDPIEYEPRNWNNEGDANIIVIDSMRAEVDKNLSTKQKKRRNKGAFGVIKQDMKFTRFTRRGIKNTRMEFLLVGIGYNLRKYHNYRIKNKKKLVIN